MKLELIGGVFIVEELEDGTERRSEIEAEVILRLVKQTLEVALKNKFFEDSELTAQDPLKKKLAKTRLVHVSRKSDRRKKT